MGVSVVIPCRNQASTLERAVKSAFAAGANEVLVFDDASTDETQSLLAEINHTTGIEFNYWTIPFRSGVSFARNKLIHHAQHDWIIPLDADDELLRIPEEYNELFWYYGGWIEHREDGTEETFTAPPAKMLNRKPLCHATMMFHKAQWTNVGGYDPDFFFGEDYAFQCALTDPGYIPIHLDYPLYKRYVGNNLRTDKAIKYWPIIQELAKEKSPFVFN